MKKRILLIFAVILFLGLLCFKQVSAYQAEPRITFTFDDSMSTTYTTVLPIMSSYKIPAVVFGETGPLNAGEDWVMTWQQIENLQNLYGWEIGSHSISHPYLTQVSDEQLELELAVSKQDFINHGINVKSFATPYGDYNDRVLAAIAKYYETHRAAWGGPNHWPDIYNDYAIVAQEVSHTTTVTQVKQWINTAITNKQWLVLLFHEIVRGTPQPYQYKLSNFRSLVSYVASKKIKPVTISQGIKLTEQTNLVNNNSFTALDSQDWAINWLRSDEINLTIDAANHGNAPEAAKSLKIIGSEASNEAKTDMINIDGATEYLIKFYVNSRGHLSGSWSISVDQFDAGNNSLGSQTLGTNFTNFVGEQYYQFNPASSSVSKIQLKFISAAGSQLTLYLDSVELRALGQAAPPAPTPANLVSNYSFEELTNNWANNWTRIDQATITVDTSGQGWLPLAHNSLKIIGGAVQRTAMSSNITVDPIKSYQLSFYQKVVNYLSGGAAVWIDEYNASGGWLSGQWLGGTYQAYQGLKSYSYKPGSVNVKLMQIHLFTEEGSQLTLYIDGVDLHVN